MTGYESKKAAAQDKLVDDRRAYYEKFDDLYAVYLNGVYDGKKAAQRTWVGLTDDERNEIASVTFGRENALALYVDAIEAKLKEKNT
jgi:hypothetical protein